MTDMIYTMIVTYKFKDTHLTWSEADWNFVGLNGLYKALKVARFHCGSFGYISDIRIRPIRFYK